MNRFAIGLLIGVVATLLMTKLSNYVTCPDKWRTREEKQAILETWDRIESIPTQNLSELPDIYRRYMDISFISDTASYDPLWVLPFLKTRPIALKLLKHEASKHLADKILWHIKHKQFITRSIGYKNYDYFSDQFLLLENPYIAAKTLMRIVDRNNLGYSDYGPECQKAIEQYLKNEGPKIRKAWIRQEQVAPGTKDFASALVKFLTVDGIKPSDLSLSPEEFWKLLNRDNHPVSSAELYDGYEIFWMIWKKEHPI